MLFELGIHGDEDVPWDWEREETQEEEEEHIKSLVQEFFVAASADPSIKGGDTSVVEIEVAHRAGRQLGSSPSRR